MYLTKLKLGTISVATVLAALAVGASFLGGGSAAPVRAQEYSCVQYRICIEKRTIGRSNVEFPFVIEIDQVDPSDANPPVGGATISGSGTVYLSDGEEVGLEFRGEATVTELPVSGWRLVDIECESSSDFSVTRRGNTIEISYITGGSQSFLYCTFINEQVRQPLNLGGLFAGQPTPLPTAPPAAAPAATAPVISPPRTGDAGLK